MVAEKLKVTVVGEHAVALVGATAAVTPVTLKGVDVSVAVGVAVALVVAVGVAVGLMPSGGGAIWVVGVGEGVSVSAGCVLLLDPNLRSVTTDCPWIKVFGEQCRAKLGHFTDRDNIDIFIQSVMLERERLRAAAERLDLVDHNGNAVFFEHFH